MRAPLQASHTQGQSQWEMPLNTSLWAGKIYLNPAYRHAWENLLLSQALSAVFQHCQDWWNFHPLSVSISRYSKISSNYTLKELSSKNASLKFLIIITKMQTQDATVQWIQRKLSEYNCGWFQHHSKVIPSFSINTALLLGHKLVTNSQKIAVE